MPRISREKKIEQLEQDIKTLTQQKKVLLAQQNVQKRKERAHRLIEIGAIALKYFNLPETTEPKEFQEYIYSQNCGEKPADKPPEG